MHRFGTDRSLGIEVRPDSFSATTRQKEKEGHELSPPLPPLPSLIGSSFVSVILH
jgi:hypothetical protein